MADDGNALPAGKFDSTHSGGGGSVCTCDVLVSVNIMLGSALPEQNPSNVLSAA